MTKRLEHAMVEAAALSEPEQDALAARILAEIDDEREWDAAFTGSQDVLIALAAEAMEEHRAGETRDLDPDTLGPPE